MFLWRSRRSCGFSSEFHTGPSRPSACRGTHRSKRSADAESVILVGWANRAASMIGRRTPNPSVPDHWARRRSIASVSFFPKSKVKHFSCALFLPHKLLVFIFKIYYMQNQTLAFNLRFIVEIMLTGCTTC